MFWKRCIWIRNKSRLFGRASKTGSALSLRQTEAIGRWLESSLVWDINQTQKHEEVDLFLSICNHCYFYPIRCWMDGRASEKNWLGKKNIEQSCLKQNIGKNQLTLNTDRGSSMKSKGVAQLLANLGVTKTHSRPNVRNNNPYWEIQFKGLKYCSEFPDRFVLIEDARHFCKRVTMIVKNTTTLAWGLVTPNKCTMKWLNKSMMSGLIFIEACQYN